MSLHQLIYLSRSVRPMTEADLDAITRGSAINNPREELTGILLYVGGNFLQLLEGPSKNVSRRFETISKDDRHRDCKIIHFAPTQYRLFPEWSMRVVNLAQWSPAAKSEFVEIIRDAESPRTASLSRIYTFLESFQSRAAAPAPTGR